MLTWIIQPDTLLEIKENQMKAIGRVTAADATGRLSVQMFYDGKWQSNWSLSNKMPANHPPFGLFEFEPEDQFCEWVDMSSI